MLEFVVISIVVAIVGGFLTAVIAQLRDQQQSFFLWWIYGFCLFAIALVHALIFKPGSRAVDRFILGTPRRDTRRPDDLKARMEVWHAAHDRGRRRPGDRPEGLHPR